MQIKVFYNVLLVKYPVKFAVSVSFLGCHCQRFFFTPKFRYRHKPQKSIIGLVVTKTGEGEEQEEEMKNIFLNYIDKNLRKIFLHARK